MNCLHCGKKISALRKLQDEEFCSAAHRKAYKKKQEDLAVDFLRQSKPRRTKAPLPQPAEPAEPQPILVLADFLAEPVAPGSANHPPRSNAQAVSISRDTVLPIPAHLPTPSPCVSGFAPLALRPPAVLPQVKPALMHAVRFAGESPRLATWVAQPLWIEAAKQAPEQRPFAGFAPFRPAWERAERYPAPAPAAIRVSSAPALMGSDVAPGGIALRLVLTLRPPILAAAWSASTHERFTNPRQLRPTPVSMPVAAIAPRAPCVAGAILLAAGKPRVRKHVGSSSPLFGPAWCATSEILHQPGVTLVPRAPVFTACQWMPPATPRASGCTVMPPAARTRRCLTSSPESPLMRSWRFAFAAPVLRSGSHVPAKAPPHRPAAAPVVNGVATLIWKSQVRMGSHSRVIPLRPRFEDPLLLEPRARSEPEPPASPWKRLAVRCSSAPLWYRQVIALVALAALALTGFGYLKSSGSIDKANSELKTRIRRRAAIDIQDDFRSGLSQWTGAPGWAGTWTYDATGFARPGRLALLAGSAPLVDYRLEFLAEIDRKAVAWVFRAVDAHNFYACKLVESKREAGAVFSILRYAMIDGHERLRIQLPLPVTVTAKSLFRVRQEIRGDQFTTYLDGRVIDTWSDASLARGGFGFFADPGEASYIRWVDVAYQDDLLGRICAYLTPGKHD